MEARDGGAAGCGAGGPSTRVLGSHTLAPCAHRLWWQANFAAQGQLLAEAETRVFQLETQRKETQHKVDRLRDYERQIEQLTATQKLWCAHCLQQLPMDIL
jgi:hypothetical protein